MKASWRSHCTKSGRGYLLFFISQTHFEFIFYIRNHCLENVPLFCLNENVKIYRSSDHEIGFKYDYQVWNFIITPESPEPASAFSAIFFLKIRWSNLKTMCFFFRLWLKKAGMLRHGSRQMLKLRHKSNMTEWLTASACWFGSSWRLSRESCRILLWKRTSVMLCWLVATAPLTWGMLKDLCMNKCKLSLTVNLFSAMCEQQIVNQTC